jgi:hypothetical protein
VIGFLESRIAPAGIVTASLKGGILSLVGDDLDNQINEGDCETADESM